MNAIIALCHFCDSHGPSAVFSTQTLRDTKLEELTFGKETVNNNCAACNSIGMNLGMLSNDEESNAHFMSTQIPVISEVVQLLKQAAVRSLSCEVSHNKIGGFVFFGDATRGHVLSHTFQIRDSQARGFNRLFSIIILMKDKLFLLNVQPFLSDQLEKISIELQKYATDVYTKEQEVYSERAQRLNSGQPNNSAPRSLAILTGEPHIFAILHSHFSWILWSGSRYLTETVTLGSPTVPPWVERETEEGFAMVQVDKEEWLLRRIGSFAGEDAIDDTFPVSIRDYKTNLRSDFISLCYCALVGIQIILRGPQPLTHKLIKCIKKFIPDQLHRLIIVNSRKFLSASECRILSIEPDVAVPQPCSNILRLEFIGESNTIKWLGEVPTKLPSLLTKIMRAIEEPLLNDTVLDKHLKVLVEDWKTKVSCTKKIHSSHELNKIKKVLGILPQDQLLVNYWSHYL